MKEDIKDTPNSPNENNGNEEPVKEQSEKIYKMPGSDQEKTPEQKLPPAPGKTDKKIPNLRNEEK